MSEYLRESEKTVWSGKPDRRAYIFGTLAGGIITIPFGLVFLIFPLQMLASIGSAPGFVLLFIIPFILIGAGFSFWPLIVGFLGYRNVGYMITNQRIIIQSGTFSVNTRFIELNNIQELSIHIGFFDRFFGTGSVSVSTIPSPRGMMYPNSSYNFSIPGTVSFSSLRDPYEVHGILDNIIKRQKSLS